MNVRRLGQDIVATELMLSRNHQVSAYDIGALLSAGVWEVEVWEGVKVVFIPTGSEVVDFVRRQAPGPGGGDRKQLPGILCPGPQLGGGAPTDAAGGR